MFRSCDISNLPNLQSYYSEVGNNFCPFLNPSYDVGLMKFTEYQIDNYSFEEMQMFIFYTGIIHTSIFRKERLRETEHKRKILFCENVIYTISTEMDGEKLFSFPHWFLKLLFTEKAVLFGKFWKGEKINNREGNPITPPPIHFLSIRSAIKPIDKRFFAVTPELTQYYLSSNDDSNDVFDFITNPHLKELLFSIESINLASLDKELILDILNQLMKSSLYSEIVNWASNKELSIGLKNYSSSQIKNNMENSTQTILQRINTKYNYSFTPLEVVRDFRGVAVQKIEMGGKFYALKFIEKNKIIGEVDYDPAYRIFSLVREAKILKDIKSDFNYHFLDDDDSEFSWLITNWVQGENSTNYLKTLKNGNQDKELNIIKAFRKIVHKFSLLHAKGIIHGDVQPVHIIFNNENNVDLLDFGLSKYLSDTNFVYKGGLVHFNAPEIAAEMIKKADNIKLDILSEIYSIGSVLFFLYTEKTSTYYGTDDYKSVPFDEKLKFIVDGNRHSFLSTGTNDIMNLEEILNYMMMPDRSKRCADLKSISEMLLEIERKLLV